MSEQTSNTAFVNGEYLTEDQAKVSIFDRGFLFGDGVYDVIASIEGKLIDANMHLNRLDNSLSEIGMQSPYSQPEIISIARELIQRNQLVEGVIYMQCTRGVAPRAFNFPAAEVAVSFIAFCVPMPLLENPQAGNGVKVISIPEQRWARRDIKSINLLAQCLGKQKAADADCYEAIMVEDGFVTEGTSSTVYIVQANTVIARPLSRAVLPGITRRALIKLLQENPDIKLYERNFTLQEVYEADEAFITSAGNFVTAVIEVDGNSIGSGKPGKLTQELRSLYVNEAMASAI